MHKGIVYAAVLVSDQDKALDFYTNVVGLTKRADNPANGGPRFVAVGVEDQEDFVLLLWPGTPGEGEPANGRIPASYTIETEDIHEAVEVLKSRGVEFDTEVLEFPFAYLAGFQDPDGNRLQLREGR